MRVGPAGVWANRAPGGGDMINLKENEIDSALPFCFPQVLENLLFSKTPGYMQSFQKL